MTKIFVPEQYVKSREIVVEIKGHGTGILISQERFRKMLADGLINADVVSKNLMKVIYEF